MAEYIEREAAVAAINDVVKDYADEHTFSTDFAAAVACELRDNAIKTIPAADVAPVRHGRWVPFLENGILRMRCGNIECYRRIPLGYLPDELPYCPYCGAKMDLEVSE